MSEDYGGYGNRESNATWFRYRAYRDEEDGRVPVGKLVRWNKDTKAEEDYSYVSGRMEAVELRENEGNPGKKVDPYNELLITLSAAKDGQKAYLKISLRAESSAAFGVARRLHAVEKGDMVTLSAFVLTDKESGERRPGITIMHVDGSSNTKIDPEETGVEFRKYQGLSGPRLTAAKNENAAIREEWLTERVADFDYFGEVEPAATPEAAEPAKVSASMPSVEEYDPFADE